MPPLALERAWEPLGGSLRAVLRIVAVEKKPRLNQQGLHGGTESLRVFSWQSAPGLPRTPTAAHKSETTVKISPMAVLA
jgi:hypothetical protein